MVVTVTVISSPSRRKLSPSLPAEEEEEEVSLEPPSIAELLLDQFSALSRNRLRMKKKH
jgi:hypothetical protein